MRQFTVKPKQNIKASKKVEAASTRDRISYLEDRIADIKTRLSEPDLAEDEVIDLGMELHELEEQLNFAWQDDEAEWNYAREQQEFNPDGSLVGYGDVYGSENVDEHEGADLYTIKIWHEVDPGRDSLGPVAQEEILQYWAGSPDEALELAKRDWQGPIDRIEIVGINEAPMDDDEPLPYSGITL